MKRILYSALILMLSAMSCSKWLDIKPTTFVSEALIWEDKALIDQFMANIYGSMICGFNRETEGPGTSWACAFGGNFDSGTDDFDGKYDASVNQFNTNEISAQNTPFAAQIWQTSYQIIRKCNMLIESMPSVAENKINSEDKNRYIAEARFLRAFNYFELARTFGKAPLITHAQKMTENLLVKPSSFDELIEFICNECDECHEYLYKEVPEALFGHASQGAFLSLKSRALLYYASPLNNPSNELKRWEEAAEAADAVRKLGVYELYTQTETPYYSMAFDETASNKEIIFSRRFLFPEMTNNIHMQWSFDPANKDGGSWNGLYPTQNLVDAFETTDGKLITDPASIYDPQNPYANRDARFYQSIVHHLSVWEGDEIRFDLYPPSAINARCGYGPRKFIEEHIGPADDLYVGTYAQDNDWPFFRYAEILLNYAEARNEALSAPDIEVYEAVNAVRTRSGQPELPSGLGKEEMRERIRNERRVELLLEEHRFFDLRRWKLADKLRETIRGMKVTEKDGTFIYTVSDIEKRYFSEDNWYLPIPQSEQEKNPYLSE